MSDWNAKIIEEFRSNAGKVGGNFERMDLLLLHSTGAKSGEERIHPLVYQSVGDDFAIFASKGGAPTHPAWYHNLIANPSASVEVGTETIDVEARVLEGDERESIWSKQKRDLPFFADYEAGTDRQIPVFLLERR
ncbi:MAG: nitroreductase family deazaflavin-dependent oxidoreductase [Acidimicrobiia bacterium]|nr:nitroreductase family deazaflavin-dependent oxidoreductase [Acidimicrobiia bacterium]NNF65116.1 nitroreductase family deazaflavin-dependent oxidoreductase [Acidimicrobiia bacterium]